MKRIFSLALKVAFLAALLASVLTVAAFSESSCHVTKPSESGFVLPEPYRSTPPTDRISDDSFWFGSEQLWLQLPKNGRWHGTDADGRYKTKLFWWHEGFDLRTEPHPALTVTAKRLDKHSPVLRFDRATNAFVHNPAMLMMVELPSTGCWQITGTYHEHSLSFIISVEQ